MTINYCDFINGDDGTGDGTFGNPYKTIDQASTGLTGGDQVRCAKSPDDINLSGTLAFVDGSEIVTTSVDLTGELTALDFIYKIGESDDIYEILSITSSIITLYKPYHGTTETVSAKKLGVTDTGVAGFNETIQFITTSGTSDALRLKISGGWNLSSQIQDSKTIFEQTGVDKDGTGLYIDSKNYLEIENLGFLRYYIGIHLYYNHYNNLNDIICTDNTAYGVYLNGSNYNTINDAICTNNTAYGIYIHSSNYNTINDAICKNNFYYGINFYESNYNTINDAICKNNNKSGIYLSDSLYNTINTPTCNFNSDEGIYLEESHENIIKTAICNNNQHGIRIYGINNIVETATCDLNTNYGIYLNHTINTAMSSITCNNNSNYGIYSNLGREDIINNYSGTENVNGDINILTSGVDPDYHILKMQHFQTEGDNRCYYQFGITYRNTIEAQSTQCLQYAATSDTYYIKQEIYFPALNGIRKDITFYIKDDVAFNGDVQAALFFMGVNITNWETIPTTTDYVQQTLIAHASDITEDGVIELKIKVRGTAGNIYVDDFGVS